MEHYGLYINGAWIEGTGGEAFETRNPGKLGSRKGD